MSRYIDAEYVNAFPIRIDHYDEKHGNRHFVLGIESVMEYIEEAPSIDIVRCKECKYFIDNLTEDDTDEAYGECCFDWDIKMPKANDYCSYGEREGE